MRPEAWGPDKGQHWCKWSQKEWWDASLENVKIQIGVRIGVPWAHWIHLHGWMKVVDLFARNFETRDPMPVGGFDDECQIPNYVLCCEDGVVRNLGWANTWISPDLVENANNGSNQIKTARELRGWMSVQRWRQDDVEISFSIFYLIMLEQRKWKDEGE